MRARLQSFARFTAARSAALLALLALAACGGGGYGGGGGGGGGRPTLTLSASPATITLGQSTTLSWTASAGTSCTASGGWTGAKAASGSETVTPAATGTATYTLDCRGGAYERSSSATATVTVNAATAFAATTLITDAVGTGAISVDANLVNAWGIAMGPTTPAWVTNNHTGTSTLYDGNGKPQPFASPLVVALPASAGGADFEPTGIVFNGSATDFTVTAAGKSAAARFIFDGEGGMIAGWAPTVDVGHAVVMYTDAGGAVYTGLAIGSNGTASFLYAADFHNGKVDVFDASYAKQAAATFPFTDASLPSGYAPFGIQAVANGAGGATQIYVAYAKQSAGGGDEEVGAGFGFVDIYDANGGFVKRLVDVGGKLNAPWGIALAPANAGTLSNALLVGNFGDGRIYGFDAATGAYVGTVVDSAGQPFAVPGLWGIAFGNGAANQPTNTLFYAAGTNAEANGAYGRIDLGATAPALNTPPVVSLTAPAAGNVSGTTTLTATATASVNIAKVEFFRGGSTLIGTATASPYSITWDTTAVADGAVQLTAKATDVDANAATSAAVAVTVANTVPAAKLSELQTLVFTPLCSGCHDGSAAVLPGAQDLRAGHAYAALVGVASLEQPALQRVKAGDSVNSYVIHKLEGAASITGARMPFGGPYLDQATLDKVKSWIDSGAPNN